MAEVLAGMSPLLQAQLDDLATAQRMEEENAQLRAALDAATATVQVPSGLRVGHCAA